MALPTAYLTTTKNLPAILDAIRNAQAPDKFTQGFLESLEFKSNADRLIIGVLKTLGFLDDSGKPTPRYYEFLDQTQSGRVLAEGIREAYADLFRVNVNAHEMSQAEVKNKFKTLGQGRLTEAVLHKMALTFTSLVKLADFSSLKSPAGEKAPEFRKDGESIAGKNREDTIEEKVHDISKHIKLGGLVYTIQIHLPETRDIAVYDALFRSLKEHLL